MLLSEITHNGTLRSIVKLNISETMLENFKDIIELRNYLRRLRVKNWKDNREYDKNHYRSDPEFRASRIQKAKQYYRDRHPLKTIEEVSLPTQREGLSESKKRGRPRKTN